MASAAGTGTFKLLRSVLFTPADLTKSFDKILKSSNTDCIIFDLEDSIHPNKKVEARDSLFQYISNMGAYLGTKELVIRVNCPTTSAWGKEDLKMVHSLKTLPTAVILPKVNTLKHIDNVVYDEFTQTINEARKNNKATFDHLNNTVTYDNSDNWQSVIPIWAMIETTQGVINVEAIASSLSVTALVFGANDLTKDLKAKHTPSREPLLYAMSKTINAGRAYNKYVIDGVHLDIQDNDGLRMSCIQGRNLGFDGKSLIHPNQIEITNECYSPSESEVLLAEKIVSAYTEAMSKGKGVCTVDGKMVEYLHVCNAQYILDTAKLIRSRK